MLHKAIIYTRVSTAGQVDGASLDTQEERCHLWAHANGIVVTRTFREEVASAKTTARPVLQEMLAYLKEHQNEINYLLIYEIDRLSRNMDDFVTILQSLKQYTIELKDPSSSLGNNSSDKLLRYIKAALAEVDNDVKAARVTDNMKRHAKNGYRMAKAPYGLLNCRDILENSTVKPASEISEPLAMLLTEFSHGTYTIKQLIALSTRFDMKRPNGKAFDHNFMGKVLRQSLYAGLERNQHTDGEFVESTFAGIVSKEVFYKNQQLLKTKKTTTESIYQSLHPDYPLRRFVRCTDCDSPVRGSASTGSTGKTYPKYHCQNCSRASVTPTKMHDQFIELLSQVKPDKLTSRLIKTMIVRVWNDELKTLHTQRKHFQAEIDKLQEHKQNATDKLVSDVITKDEKIAIHQRAEERIGVVGSELNALSNQMGTKQDAIDYALVYMDNAPQLWRDASPEMRATYQLMILPEGIQYDFAQKKFGTPAFGALYTLANIKRDPSKADESLLVTCL